MTRIKTILVPTDFSEPADAAWRYAQGLAAQLGSRIHLLHVVAEPFLYDAWGTDAGTLRTAGLVADFEAVASRQLARLVPSRGPLAGRVTTDTRTGLTVPEILDGITRRKADLVVVGTHGRGAIGHALLGSVAEKLVRLSPVPVLTVHGRAVRARAPGGAAAARDRRAGGGTHAALSALSGDRHAVEPALRLTVRRSRRRSPSSG